MSVRMAFDIYTKEDLTEGFIRRVFKAVEASGFTYHKFDRIEVEGEPFGKQVPVPVEEHIKRIFKPWKLPSGKEVIGRGALFKIKSKEESWEDVFVFIGKEKDYILLSLRVSDHFLVESHKNEDMFFNVIRNVIKTANPVFGMGGNSDVLSKIGDTERIFKYIKKASIAYIPWTLYLGPDYLKKYGEEKLLKTPALIAEKIGDGIFIVRGYMNRGEDDSDERSSLSSRCLADAYKYLENLLKPRKL